MVESAENSSVEDKTAPIKTETLSRVESIKIKTSVFGVLDQKYLVHLFKFN